MKQFLLLTCSIFLFFSCAPAKVSHRVKKSGEVLSFTSKNGLNYDSKNPQFIQIPKLRLNQEYLLRAHIIPQSGAATGNSLKSRIVRFFPQNSKLYLLENNDGFTVTDALPTNRIITSFSIVKESNTHLVINWTEGMNKAFADDGWYASDFEGMDFKERNQIIKIEESFISNKSLKNNTIFINQIAQALIKNQSNTSTAQHIELRYALSPYAQNVQFKSFLTSDKPSIFDSVGFFENSPRLEKQSGRSIVMATKFDTSKPIIFHISPNTPADYRDAVKRGILYWNRYLQNPNQIQVKIAPQNVSAPSFGYNMVQWVEWDNAGFAYADANMDPRTGQIIQANAYLTSVFAISSIKRARRLLRSLENTSTPTGHTGHKFNHHLCEKSTYLDSKYKNQLKSLLSLITQTPTINDQTVKDISMHMVFDVVAHEVGHTLGLRHNFAGNLALKSDISTLNDDFLNYVSKKTIPQKDSVYLSSVMEYATTKDSLLNSVLANNFQDYKIPYDQKAISVLYNDQDYLQDSSVLFCTDTHRNAYLDCQTFDSGKNYLNQNSFHISEELNTVIPRLILEKFYLGKFPDDLSRKRTLVKDTVLIPSSYKNRFHFHVKELLKFHNKDLNFLALERNYKNQSVLPLTMNKLRVEKKSNEWMTFKNNAGNSALQQLLDLFYNDQSNKHFTKSIKNSVESLLNKKSTVYNASFNAQEKTIILTKLDSLLSEVKNSYLDDLTKELTNYKVLNYNTTTLIYDDLESYYSELSELLLGKFSVDEFIEEEITSLADNTKFNIKVPQHKFSNNLRNLAKKLVKSDNNPFGADWMFYQKIDLLKKSTSTHEDLSKDLPKDFINKASLKKYKMSRELREWLRFRLSLSKLFE